MTLIKTVKRVVPTLKCNNRRRSLIFFEENLGMKNLLEEGAWVSLGDKSQIEKLTLEEAPSNRTRAVKGTKKLSKLIIKVDDPREIEALLAQGSRYSQLYQGKKGYAFESYSPEGDCILLHAEENLASLKEIEATTFQEDISFTGLTHFDVQEIVLNVSQPQLSQTFYENLFLDRTVLSFLPAQGFDLDAPNEETWDLSQLKFIVKEFKARAIKEKFPDSFLARSGKFLTLLDPSQIELWFEIC